MGRWNVASLSRDSPQYPSWLDGECHLLSLTDMDSARSSKTFTVRATADFGFTRLIDVR